MAYTASRTSIGFEFVRNIMLGQRPNPHKYELTPNLALEIGDMVVLTNGKVAKATSSSTTGLLGVMAEAFTTSTNPTAGLTLGLVEDNPFNIYRVTFCDHSDRTATGGSTTTLVDTDLSTSTNDFWNGALLYIYEGTNKGCVRTVSDYAGDTDTLTVTYPFPAAIDTTSKYVLLGLAGEANDVINRGSRGLVLKDEARVDANAGVISSTVLVGPLVCMRVYPELLMMDVMIRMSCHAFS